MNPNHLWASGQEVGEFWKAIENGSLTKLRRIVSSNPKVVRWQRRDSTTPMTLFAMSRKPSLPLLDCLLSLGFGIDGAMSDPYLGGGRNPLLIASINGRLVAAKSLLQRGADPNRDSGYFSFPLHAAAERNRPKLVEELLKWDANPNQVDCHGMLPIDYAREHQYRKCEKLLEAVTTPSKRKNYRTRPRRTKTLRIDAVSKVDKIRSTIRKAVREYRKTVDKPVTAIGIHATAILGFVEVGFATDAFDPSRSDCVADIEHPALARVDFPQWKKSFEKAAKLEFVYRDGTPLVKSNSASCETLEKPLFDLLCRVLKHARKNGDFAKIEFAEEHVFGVQVYFHTHCKFWNQRGVLVKNPAPWDQPEKQTTATKQKSTSKAAKTKKASRKSPAKKSSDPNQGWPWREIMEFPQTSNGIATTPDGCLVAAANNKSVMIWEPPTKKPIAKISNFQYIDDLAFDGDGRYLFVQDREENAIYDVEADKLVTRRKKVIDAHVIECAGSGVWVAAESYPNQKVSIVKWNGRTLKKVSLKASEDFDVSEVGYDVVRNRVYWMTGVWLNTCSLKNGVPGALRRHNLAKGFNWPVHFCHPVFHPKKNWIAMYAYSHDRKKQTNSICLVDVSKKKLIACVPSKPAHMWWSPDGKHLICSCLSNDKGEKELSLRSADDLSAKHRIGIWPASVSVALASNRVAMATFGKSFLFET